MFFGFKFKVDGYGRGEGTYNGGRNSVFRSTGVVERRGFEITISQWFGTVKTVVKRVDGRGVRYENQDGVGTSRRSRGTDERV